MLSRLEHQAITHGRRNPSFERNFSREYDDPDQPAEIAATADAEAETKENEGEQEDTETDSDDEEYQPDFEMRNSKDDAPPPPPSASGDCRSMLV